MVMFDTLGLADDLEQAGLQPEVARKMASALGQRLKDGIATKSDIQDVRREIADTKASLIQWFGGIVIAQGAAIVALIKLLP